MFSFVPQTMQIKHKTNFQSSQVQKKEKKHISQADVSLIGCKIGIRHPEINIKDQVKALDYCTQTVYIVGEPGKSRQ